MDTKVSGVELDALYERVLNMAQFAREILPLSIDKLRDANPSFPMMAKLCDLIYAILKDANHNRAEQTTTVMNFMKTIATAIDDRDDQNLVDCICEMDEFFETHRKL